MSRANGADFGANSPIRPSCFVTTELATPVSVIVLIRDLLQPLSRQRLRPSRTERWANSGGPSAQSDPEGGYSEPEGHDNHNHHKRNVLPIGPAVVRSVALLDHLTVLRFGGLGIARFSRQLMTFFGLEATSLCRAKRIP
jgi:hypothetical protein